MNKFTQDALKEGIEFSYTDDGKIEVLVSPNYGAGWSTWNEISMALDKRIIDYFKEHGKEPDCREVEAFVEGLGYRRCFAGGWYDIEIETVEKGEAFMITEYDGFEELVSYGRNSFYEL